MEWNAAHVVAHVTGERVILQDDGSQMRMPDIRIEHASGDVAYIEVWTDTDQDAAAVLDELYGRERQLPREWPAPPLRRVWSITVSRRARFKSRNQQPSLERDLIRILGQVEHVGETFERVADEGRLRSSKSQA